MNHADIMVRLSMVGDPGTQMHERATAALQGILMALIDVTKGETPSIGRIHHHLSLSRIHELLEHPETTTASKAYLKAYLTTLETPQLAESKVQGARAESHAAVQVYLTQALVLMGE